MLVEIRVRDIPTSDLSSLYLSLSTFSHYFCFYLRKSERVSELVKKLKFAGEKKNKNSQTTD